MLLAPPVASHHTQRVRLQGLMPRLKPPSPTGWFRAVCIRTSSSFSCCCSGPDPWPACRLLPPPIVPQPAPVLARAASTNFPTFNLSFPIQEPLASLGSWSSQAPPHGEEGSPACFPAQWSSPRIFCLSVSTPGTDEARPISRTCPCLPSLVLN